MRQPTIVIQGRNPLSGSVRISGAKNAALPELAAVALSSAPFSFRNVPRVEDIKVIYRALRGIGGEGRFVGNEVQIRISEFRSAVVPTETVQTTRASILLLGPLLARNGYARVSFPGGCSIGERKINFHLEGLERMGARIESEGEYLVARTDRLRGVEYAFPRKTVTGTENLLMAATLAEGTTVLRNCALEPEVGDLVDLLLKMGARIGGKGTDTLEIAGKTSLGGADHEVIPDRIEAGTYAIAGCFAGNSITVEGADPLHLSRLIDILRAMGVGVGLEGNRITVHPTERMRPVDIDTAPYPGYPTDLQAQITTLLTQADGVSRVRETIFNDRFKHVGELNRLGASIEVRGDTALIRGKTKFAGAVLKTTDLRASAALVLGGLIANGRTAIRNAYQLFRGYENMPRKLQKLGAAITIEEEAE
jgi:UDP-N-acetylglucosamine 1-carboxyvinyltransferase